VHERLNHEPYLKLHHRPKPVKYYSDTNEFLREAGKVNGASARDCVLTPMASLLPLPSNSETPVSLNPHCDYAQELDLGPKTGFTTKDWIPFCDGIGGWRYVMNVKERLGRWRRIGMG
jgi:hypothetical protein